MVSVLFNEPKLLKGGNRAALRGAQDVSVLFNEPKLLKSTVAAPSSSWTPSFSALQRAEIAEIMHAVQNRRLLAEVSVLFNEPKLLKLTDRPTDRLTS